MQNCRIRLAVKSDCNSIRNLAQENANNVSDPQITTITIENLENDGFGDESYFKCFIAEVMEASNGEDTMMKTAGFALFYNIYSTWEGRSIKLEELYVSPTYKNLDIEVALLNAVVNEAVKTKSSRIDCPVSSEHQSTIEFLKRNGATDLTSTEDWHLFRLPQDSMKNFSN